MKLTLEEIDMDRPLPKNRHRKKLGVEFIEVGGGGAQECALDATYDLLFEEVLRLEGDHKRRWYAERT